MVNYIINNKEWLFSGIGVAFLSVVIVASKWIYSRYNTNNKNSKLTIKSANNNYNSSQLNIISGCQDVPKPTTKEKVNTFREKDYSEHPSAKDIEDRIDGLPPYQQKDAIYNYVGLKVKWKVSLSLVHKSEGNFVKISCKDLSGYRRFVMSKVNLGEYPQIKAAEKNKPFIIYGKILGMDSSGSGFILRIDRIDFNI